MVAGGVLTDMPHDERQVPQHDIVVMGFGVEKNRVCPYSHALPDFSAQRRVNFRCNLFQVSVQFL